jgi:hypothetical protein
MHDAGTNWNRSFNFPIVEWDRNWQGEGVGEPMLSWKDKFDEVSCTFQLRLKAGIR